MYAVRKYSGTEMRRQLQSAKEEPFEEDEIAGLGDARNQNALTRSGVCAWKHTKEAMSSEKINTAKKI